MNKGEKSNKDEAHEEFARQAAHKKETEADLKRLDDAAHALKKRHAADDEKRTAVVSHEAHVDLEARVTKLEEAVRLASPEAAAHLDKKI